MTNNFNKNEYLKDMQFFSSNTNDWNYNQLLLFPIVDSRINKKNYVGLKYNAKIILLELLKHVNLNNDLIDYINNKCLNNNCNYWQLINITAQVYNYLIYKKDNNYINLKDLKNWIKLNKFYYNDNCKDIDIYEGNELWEKINNRNDFNKLTTYNNINNKIYEIVDNEELKNKLLIMLYFFKNKIISIDSYNFDLPI